MSDAEVVRAAGGVVLRGVDGKEDEVLVVYRSRYGDWTLPKGKREGDESDEACALREVREETGLDCELLDELGSTEYLDSQGRRKHVRWWAMQAVSGEARPAPPEVDEVRWVPLGAAPALLTHPRDAGVVASSARRRAKG
jgi:8-oxo-dGTP pyrophosphatase MutT (NUDIX family)